MNFSYKQKQDVFANISTASVLPKCKMVCTTSGTTKQAPKPSRTSTEINSHVVHAFPVQLRAKGTKIFTSFFYYYLLFKTLQCTYVYLYHTYKPLQ